MANLLIIFSTLFKNAGSSVSLECIKVEEDIIVSTSSNIIENTRQVATTK